jgi:hypothetical protein
VGDQLGVDEGEERLVAGVFELLPLVRPPRRRVLRGGGGPVLPAVRGLERRRVALAHGVRLLGLAVLGLVEDAEKPGLAGFCCLHEIMFSGFGFQALTGDVWPVLAFHGSRGNGTGFNPSMNSKNSLNLVMR